MKKKKKHFVQAKFQWVFETPKQNILSSDNNKIKRFTGIRGIKKKKKKTFCSWQKV